jgi:hypothetical protein
MSEQVAKSNNAYYLANRERILAKSKERYNKRSLDDKEKAKTYQREYYRVIRSLVYTPPTPKPSQQQIYETERTKPPVVPAVKTNTSDVIPTFN